MVTVHTLLEEEFIMCLSPVELTFHWAGCLLSPAGYSTRCEPCVHTGPTQLLNRRNLWAKRCDRSILPMLLQVLDIERNPTPAGLANTG